MMKNCGLRARSPKVLSLFGSVERLEERSLLTLFPFPTYLNVDPGDVRQLVYEADYDQFYPNKMIGDIVLDGNLEAVSESNSKDRGDIPPLGSGSWTDQEMLLSTVQMEVRGTLEGGRFSSFDARAETAVSKSAIVNNDVVYSDFQRASGFLIISGWGHLDLYVHGLASTSRTWEATSETATTNFFQAEIDVQETECDFHITAHGKFNVVISVTAKTNDMVLGVNLASDQTVGNVIASEAGVYVSVQAPRYSVSGDGRTETTLHNSDNELFAAKSYGDVACKGQRMFTFHINSTRETMIGYDYGNTWSKDVMSSIELSCGAGGKGWAEYRMSSDYGPSRITSYPQTTRLYSSDFVKFSLKNQRVADETVITAGENLEYSALLDQLFADYLGAKVILGTS